MVNSNDKRKKLPLLDYSESNLPEDIKKAVSTEPYTIEKEGKLTDDGRQFLIRIPKEIAQEANITAETKVKFKFVKPLPNENRKASPNDVKINLG